MTGEKNRVNDLHSPCAWCGRRSETKKVGGHWKRFCSLTCKNKFHTAARHWVQTQVEDGRLSIADLKNLSSSSCTTK